tara:strand:+ start:16 stop:888 length:873 start_codon:yes stop_codon:yes gene_type:complete
MMSYHNNYTPPRRTPTTPTPPVAPVSDPVPQQQTDTGTGEVITNAQEKFVSRPTYITDTSVSEKTNVTQESLALQINSKFYKDSERSPVSEESTTYFSYLESKGVVFTIFAEERAYSENFTNDAGDRGSYPSSQTARYHFVQMITPGNTLHNFQTPLSNGNMKNAHPELTDEKIDVMRATYDQNQNIRPFAYPIQVRNASVEDIEKLKQNEMQLFSYVNAKKPLNVVSTAPYERPNLTRGFSNRTNKGTVPYMSVQRPRAAENGDLWFDQKHGRLYVFMSLVSGSYWVEV